MTEKNTLKFDDKLEAFTRAYNNTYHSKIRRTPNSITKENEMDIWREIYMPDYQVVNKRKPKFSIDDKVRISSEKITFRKGRSYINYM
jgi:hypothetical protein